MGSSNFFGMREASSEPRGSQVVEKMSNDIDCASYRSREKQIADGQPKEAAKTSELVLGLRHVGSPVLYQGVQAISAACGA